MSPDASAVDVHVSLVNTNNRELLRRCLASLPEAAGRDVAWRATVVDNASSDGSAEMVRAEFPRAQLRVNAARLGFSANHNQVLGPVVAEDVARYVLVLNEDTELRPGSLAELVRFADERRDAGAVGPGLVAPDGRRQVSFFAFPSVRDQFGSTLVPGRAQRTVRGSGWLNGSCLLLRTEALREVGLLDERFFIFFEDTDMGLRLCRAGWSSELCETATVVHHEHQTVSRQPADSPMERQFLRSRYLYFRKHRGRLAAVWVAALVRAALTARAAKALLGSLAGNRAERVLARLLWRLARYDPNVPLAHEALVRGNVT